jgi:hypothetical protein
VPDWLHEWLWSYTRDETPTEARPFDGIVSPWAQAIIDDELEQLRATGEGGRNDALARVSFKLGQLAGGGEADGDVLVTDLRAIAADWPDEDKSFDTIARCFAAGLLRPRVAPEPLSLKSNWERGRISGKQWNRS